MKQFLGVYSLLLFVFTPPFQAFLIPCPLKYKTFIKGKNINGNVGPKRDITAIEYHLKNDRKLRAKILQDKWNKQLKRFKSMRENNDSPSQRMLIRLLALSAVMEEWSVFKTVQDSIEEYGFSSDSNTYHAILKECMSNGNGVAALKVLEDMKSQSSNIKPRQEDLKLVIIALCRQNKYSPGLWKKALQLIYFAAAALEKGELVGNPVSVEAYNQLINCMGDDNRWEDVLELLEMMEENSRLHPPPTLATYDRALSALISSDRVDVATELLLSMAESKKIVPTVYSYETVLSAILRNQSRTNWKPAKKLIDSMQELNIVAPTIFFNRVISACAKARELQAASDVFNQMKQQNIPPDTVTYNSLISAAANTGRANAALRLFEMCKEDTGVDVITYTNTIRACARDKMSKKAIQLLQDAKRSGMPLDAFIYTATIDACAKACMWKDALKVLNDMKDNNILPNEFTFSSAITACGNCGQWTYALDLLDEMKKSGIRINTTTYNAAITALSKGARQNIKGGNDTNTDNQKLWLKATELLEEMKSTRMRLDQYTYSAVISCCSSGGRYQEALSLIKEMRDGSPYVRPNLIAYTGAISACARSGEWSHALKLFVDMKADRIQFDIVAYNALISAFANAGEQDMVFQLWNDLCKGSGEIVGGTENIFPDIITVSTVISSLDNGFDDEVHKLKVDDVFADAVRKDIIFSSDSMDTEWEYDLSGMSLPVARAAVRYIVSRFSDKNSIQDLNFITGVGRHHQNDSKAGSTSLRDYVKQVLLLDFDPPLSCSVAKGAEGIVVIEKNEIEKWLLKI